MQSEAHEPLTLAVVFENLQALQKTFALKAAIELDIFGAVGKGFCDVASIAKHAKTSERDEAAHRGDRKSVSPQHAGRSLHYNDAGGTILINVNRWVRHGEFGDCKPGIES